MLNTESISKSVKEFPKSSDFAKFHVNVDTLKRILCGTSYHILVVCSNTSKYK